MKIPSFKRIVYTDFPNQFQQLVEQLSYTINNGFENIQNVLNNNVSLRDNFYASVKDVTLTVNSAGVPLSTAAFSIDNSNPVDGLYVIRAINNTNASVFPTSGIFISYTQSGAKVTINSITGLPANNSYTIRVIAYLT